MNVLFLSADFPLPTDRGFRVRTLMQLQLLASIAAVESIVVLALCNGDVGPPRIQELECLVDRVRVEPPEFHPLHFRGSARSMATLAWQRLGRGVPYIVASYDHRGMHEAVERHLLTNNYDLVYLGFLGMASYLPLIRRLAPRARVVLEQHNVEWQIFDRLTPRVSLWLRPLVRWEARATRRFERDCLPNVDAVIAISRLDAEAFFDLAGIDSVVVPPWLEPRIPRVEVTTAPALIYVGTPDWLPNAYGLDWFCRKVWPLVREQMPETTLTIAGGGRPGAADGGDRMHPEWRVPGIKASGFVKDLEPLYCRALAFIAPVLGGSGVRMKLLEAFSAGLPAVTTSDGAAGLDVAHGRELLIADTACAFADSVVQLLRDADLREGLRRRGRAFLSANHSRAGSRAQLARALGVSLQAEAPRIAMAGS